MKRTSKSVDASLPTGTFDPNESAEGARRHKHGRADRRWDFALFVGIAAVALVLRLVYVWQMRRDNPLFDAPVMDEMYHDQWARAIAAGERFVDGAYFRAPLYPALLGLLFKLFGPSYLLPRVLQAIVGSLSCGLVYLLGRTAFNRWTGALAGISAGFYWILIYFDGELLIPTIIVFLDLLLILLLVKAARSSSPGIVLAAGLVLGLSAIARPNILAFAPFAAIWILVVHRVRLKRAVAQAAALTAGTLLIVAPVTIRNYVVGDDWVLIGSQGGVNFFIGNNPQSDGRTAVVPGTPSEWWAGYHASIERAERARGRKLRASEVSDYYYEQAFEFIEDQPRTWAKLMRLKFRLFWTAEEIPNNKGIYFWAERAAVMRFLPLGFGVVAPIGLLGMVLTICCRQPGRMATFPLWGFVLVYMATVVLFFCTARYRVPIVPILILFGAHAVTSVTMAFRQRRWRYVILALVLCAPAFALVHASPPTHAVRNDAFSHIRMALAFKRRGDLMRAEESYREALQVDSTALLARLNYGKLLYGQKRWDEAIAQFRAALNGPMSVRAQFRDDLYEIHRYLAFALTRTTKFEEAIEHYRNAVSMAPRKNDGYLHFNLAVCLQNVGQTGDATVAFGEAGEVLRQQLTRKPNDASLRCMAGRAFYEAGRFGDAVVELEKCVALDSTDKADASLLQRARHRAHSQ